MRTQVLAGAAAVVATGVVAACAGAAGTAGADAYLCAGVSVPVAVLADPRPASDLGPDGLAALDGAEMPPASSLGDLATWWVVTETAEHLVLIRPLAVVDDHGAGDVRTHELLSAAVVDSVNVKGWLLERATTCALTVDVPGADSATVTLDPARPLDPAASELSLLVTERACNSGQDATGRVRLASLVETATTVELVVAVTPRGGGATCPSNPATPFTLALTDPLGDRTVLDASVFPARTLTPP